MIFKGKQVKVIITGDAKIELEELNKTVGEEISMGITSRIEYIINFFLPLSSPRSAHEAFSRIQPCPLSSLCP